MILLSRALRWFTPDAHDTLCNDEVLQVLECLPYGCTLMASYWRSGAKAKQALPFQLSPGPPLMALAICPINFMFFYSGNEDTTQQFESETLSPLNRDGR